jgi:two-component system sensor histidine kinase QseC
MSRREYSVRRRLLVLVLGAVAACWLLAVAATWLDARHELDELLDGHLAQAAALLLAPQGGDGDGDEHGVDAPVLHRYAPKVAFQVFRGTQLTMRSANAPVAAMLEPGLLPPGAFGVVTVGADRWRIFSAADSQRDVRVYVAETLDSRTSILWAVLRSMFWPAAIAFPLLAAALWGGIEWGVAPLRRLRSLMAQRQPDALQPFPQADLPTEMVPMVETLNGLFQRIAGLVDSERRFTGDAAHELRTPIAAIRAHAQVALGEADDRARTHALRCVVEGCDRAGRVVEQLLTLSRLESEAAPVMQELDLRAIVHEVAAQLVPVALKKRQCMEVEAGEPCPTRGDATLLAILVRNLIDNAIRYSPPDARIAIELCSRPGQGFRLNVQDSGPGMPDDALVKLGERFFRLLGSSESGSGLGWSIVRRIADVHRFRVIVGRSSDLGGLSVVVEPGPSAS